MEKVVPLTLIAVFLFVILLRVSGVIPTILTTDEFEISRTIFVDAGIGGLLAVLAIVISLTLMGIQFASQEYTHRVMNTYMKSVMLWSMIITYIATVLYNLYMTAFLKLPVDTMYADISVLLQTLCLIMLVPHFINAVIHLRPDYTLGRIMRTIDEEYVSSLHGFLTEGRGRVPSEVDRLLPAVEIIEKSIARGDRETVRVALEGIHDLYNRYVTPENEDWVARYFLDYLLRIGREAIIEADDDSLVQVLGVFGDIGVSASGMTAARKVVEDIDIIGIGALRKDYDAAVEQMVDSLHQMLRPEAAEETCEAIFSSSSELADQLFLLAKKRLIRYLIGSLANLRETVLENQERGWIKNWSSVMEIVGRSAVAHRFRDVVHEAIQGFYLMGTSAARREQDSTSYTIEPLLRMEREVAQQDRELVAEIEYVKNEIEQAIRKHVTGEEAEAGIDTSDLW